jgi:FlaG/FlaF family flagellin (archaellin)
MRSRLLVAVWILLAAMAIAPVFGKGSKKKSTSAPQQPVISSVTGNAITVTQQKTARTFMVTQFTEITLNGQRASIAELKPGMAVSVTIGVDPSQAARVIATGVPKGKK